MDKTKARDVLRDAVSYIIEKNKNVNGTEEFVQETNDMEDFLIARFFNQKEYSIGKRNETKIENAINELRKAQVKGDYDSIEKVIEELKEITY